MNTLNTRSMKLLLAGLLALLLSACDNDQAAVSDDTPEPPIVIVTPTVITGVAASGAALDGATIEIIDASGNLVDIPDTLTGSDGSYQVTLPAGVALPVIVRVTPPGGEPLLNIVPEPEGDETDVVANINPITSLVSSSLLGDADGTDNAALAGALATVDPDTIDESGDEIVERLLGNSVDYSRFNSDPDFVAKTGDSSTTPSATDAILDTLARQAQSTGTTVQQRLRNLNQQADPPRLLQQPDFQVGLVSEMVKGGTATADLESRLTDIGAIAAAGEGTTDVFRAVIATVPALIESVRTESTALAGDEDLLEVAVNAAVDLLATTVKEKKDRFATNDAGLVSALNSPSLQQTVTKVVQSSVVPVLTNFVGSGSTATIKTNLTKVVGEVTQQAAVVASSFSYTETSTNVSNLVSGFVAAQVTPPTTAEALESAASGQTQAVQNVGDVNTAKSSIESFAGQNQELVEGPIEELIETVPPGTWSTSKWGGFNWG